MGKQWLLCKVAGDGGSGTCHATGKPSSTSNKKTAGKSRKRDGDKQMPSSSSSSSSFGGCMSAIFHLFDIQHHHLPFHQPSFIPEEPNIILKGVEAPRNSLELEEQEPNVAEVASSSSSSSKTKQETNFSIPMKEIQIKTKRSRLLSEDASSECSSSPSTKTPNLVARLMGLDLLPENSSPRPSSSSPRVSSSSSYATPLNSLSKLSSHKYNTRSLPATPRISTAGPTTEVDYHHRFSLQINKENNKRRCDESASEYAKQIAKQVRENISRRVGADITNTVKKNEHRRDEYLVVLKPKRPSPPSTAAVTGRSRNLDQGHGRGKENYEPIPVSCSSRLRLLEIKNNLNKPNSNSLNSLSSSSSEVIKAPPPSSTTKLSPPLMKEEVQVVKQDQKPLKVQKCKRIASEKYDLRLKNMHQQEEPFMKPKLCNKKSTPLSNHLVKVNTTTKFISFKKDMASTPSTTILSSKQVPLSCITQLPICQSRSYNTNGNGITITPNGNGLPTTTTTTTGSSVTDHSDYISRILRQTGIEKTTPISISHWYSPSHPLHPSIFHQLETQFSNSCDRKLIFDVVDELLVDILKPYISLKPWALEPIRNSHRMLGWEVVENLCEKIRCFPAADCQVLEDIDGLIAGDMKMSTRVVGAVAFEEEAEELVAEMERDMVDTLVHEMAAGIISYPTLDVETRSD